MCNLINHYIRSSLFICCLLMNSVQANNQISVETSHGEEVSIHVHTATFLDASFPKVLWFTEGYSSRDSFKDVIRRLNDEGYEVWQVDLLESYFLQRTPANVRSLKGEGVEAALSHLDEKDNFIVISTGRMNLAVLRGIRLWQLKHPQKTKRLQQMIMFFPNLFDAPLKAGDSPELFPITESSQLPITIVQPSNGTFKWKLPMLIHALEKGGSNITLVAAPNARDWYFLRRDPTEQEKQLGNKISEHIRHWLFAASFAKQSDYLAIKDFTIKNQTKSLKGLVELTPKPAFNFALNEASGEFIRFNVNTGKVLLLNFWASWCPPCVKEIPSMNRLAQSFDKDQFEIVSVNFKESPQKILQFIKQVNVDFAVLMDEDGKVSSKYEIFAFPSSFLIDTKGKLRYSVNTAIEWDDPVIKEKIHALIDESSQ